METSAYKELSYKVQSFRLVSWLIGAVVLLLCLLVGIGAYILFIGMNGVQTAPQQVGALKEEVTVFEGQFKEPINPKMASKYHEEEQIHEDLLPLSSSPLEHYEESHEIPQSEESIIDALSALTNRDDESPLKEMNNRASQHYMDQTLKMFNDYTGGFEGSHDFSHRVRRSLSFGMGYIPFVSYASFGTFLYNQVSNIAQHRIESRSMQGRKLSGDPDADYLDGGYFKNPEQSIVKKSSANSAQKDVQSQKYEPMVNQVPMSFVAEILKTLLTLMKEFLMKDHVMECLWFMFCQDVNHQARHTDLYGMLARVNSVGLKVLIEKEVRETDTFADVFRAVTSWQPLQCDAMFPRCDGTRALEIVNEVAVGSE